MTFRSDDYKTAVKTRRLKTAFILAELQAFVDECRSDAVIGMSGNGDAFIADQIVLNLRNRLESIEDGKVLSNEWYEKESGLVVPMKPSFVEKK